MKKETFAAYANLCALKKREAHDAMAQVEQEVEEARRAIDENKARMAEHDQTTAQRLLGGMNARFLDLLERERTQLEREILASRARLDKKQARKAQAHEMIRESDMMERRCEKIGEKLEAERSKARARREETEADELSTRRAAVGQH